MPITQKVHQLRYGMCANLGSWSFGGFLIANSLSLGTGTGTSTPSESIASPLLISIVLSIGLRVVALPPHGWQFIAPVFEEVQASTVRLAVP